MALRYIGQRIVIRLNDTWKRGYLVGVDAPTDRVWIKYTKYGRIKVLRGIWRVHMHTLFSANAGLPAPLYPAKIVEVTNNPRRVQMATRVTRSKAGAKKPAAKKPTPPKDAAAANGDAPKTRKDKLGHLTESQRKKAAAIIFKMRGEGKPWPEVMEELESKNMPIPGSMTGRRLLREYHDEGDSVIRERVKSADKDEDEAPAKKKSTRTKAKAKAADVEEEEEEEEEEAPQPKRRVRVKRGAGKKSNPS